MLEKDPNYEYKITKFPLPFSIELTPYEVDYSEKVLRFCKQDLQITELRKSSKIVIIGDIGVGKTSLVNRFCYGNFDTSYKATIGVDFAVSRFDVLGIRYSVQIWDTAGQERFKSMAKSYYRGANVIVVVFDLSKMNTLTNCKQWYDDAMKENENNASPPRLFLIGNKLDSISLTAYDSVQNFVTKMLHVVHAEYWPVSSKTGININELFKRIAALAFQSAVRQEISASNNVSVIEIGKIGIIGKDVKHRRVITHCHACNIR